MSSQTWLYSSESKPTSGSTSARPRIKCVCPACGIRLSIKRSCAGKQLICPNIDCGVEFLAPSSAAHAPQDPVPLHLPKTRGISFEVKAWAAGMAIAAAACFLGLVVFIAARGSSNGQAAPAILQAEKKQDRKVEHPRDGERKHSDGGGSKQEQATARERDRMEREATEAEAKARKWREAAEAEDRARQEREREAAEQATREERLRAETEERRRLDIEAAWRNAREMTDPNTQRVLIGGTMAKATVRGSFRFSIGLDGIADFIVNDPGSLWFIMEGGFVWNGVSLKAGEIYHLDHARQPRLTRKGEYSAWIIADQDHAIEKFQGGGELAGRIRAGDRVQILSYSKSDLDWHRVRVGSARPVEGWVRGPIVGPLAFLKHASS